MVSKNGSFFYLTRSYRFGVSRFEIAGRRLDPRLEPPAFDGEETGELDARIQCLLDKPVRQLVLERWIALPLSAGPERKVAPPASEPETSPQAPKEVIESAALENIRRLQRPGEPDLLRKVIGLYVEDAPELLSRLEKEFMQVWSELGFYTRQGNAAGQ